MDFCYLPAQNTVHQINHRKPEIEIIEKEIAKLLQKGVIYKCGRVSDDFVSSIFARPKQDGSHRMILNLKRLNQNVEYKHFKVESLLNVLNIIKPNVYMASVDLKDAFYSVPIHEENQKYFKFAWGDSFYSYRGMPNGYGPAMRIFTKILKPPFSALRRKGHESVVFVDDTYLQGDNFEDCRQNVISTINLLRKLGFTIQNEKSVLIPTQSIQFLGFILNTISMRISLSHEKSASIKKHIIHILAQCKITIRELASIIGKIVACFPAFLYGKMHYRNLEKQKIDELKKHKGKFEACISLSEGAKENLYYWEKNIEKSGKQIKVSQVDLIIHTDASLKGWGATNGSTPIGGKWLEEELDHINVLELKAVKFALYSYCKERHFQHIQVMCDNKTAIAYINNMGGTKSVSCDTVATEIWNFCMRTGTWISAAHIPGIENIVADKKSREFNDCTEWQLNPKIFVDIVEVLNLTPDIDLFATRLNKQLPKYVSWDPDPGSLATDAFSMTWENFKFYAFPPFSVIGAVVSKIIKEKADGIMIIPNWNTQYWLPTIMSLLVEKPVLIPASINMLRLPFDKSRVHPLYPKLDLLAVRVSGVPSRTSSFLKKLRVSSLILGDQEHRNVTGQFGTSGTSFVLKGTRIPFTRLFKQY